MDKNIHNVSFDDIKIEDYKEEVENINNMLDEIMKDKKIIKTLKKMQEKEKIRYSYNNIPYNNIKKYKEYNTKTNSQKIHIYNPKKSNDIEYAKNTTGAIFG